MYKISELKSLASNCSVLYVEDDENIAYTFKNYLEKIFFKVVYRNNGQAALDTYKKESFDLIITDVKMPIMDGITMASKIKEINEEQNILITSAYSDSEKFISSIKIGVDGYILKPIDYDNLNTTLFKIMTKVKKFKEHDIYERNLEKLLKEKNKDNLKLSLEKIDNYEKTLYALIDIIESRDTYTGKHSLRVANYSKLIAQELNFSKKECDEIYRAGILHDIGKIAIPDSLLLKPGKLSLNEYNLIKEHVNIGFNMLSQIPMFKEIAQVINCHHERIDGSGYPSGLKGEEIPFKANIMALADSFDAMTTSRIYRARKSIDEALQEISSLSNIHFKKEIVDASLKVLTNIEIDDTITQLPQNKLEQERFSYFYKDPLTNIFNEKYLNVTLSKNAFDKKFEKIYIIFLEDFSKYNKRFSWAKGNEFLVQISEKISELFNEFTIFRIHGDDYALINHNNKAFEVDKYNELKEFINLYSKEVSLTYKEINITKNDIDSISALEKNI